MATAFAGTWVEAPHAFGMLNTKAGIAKLTMPASCAAGATGEDIATALSFTTHFDSVYGVIPMAATLAGMGQCTWAFYGTDSSSLGVTSGKLASYWSADGTDGEVFKAVTATTDYEAQVEYMYVLVLGYEA